jgi:dTDP-4-dehydrorhamnose 3,5-epimerase
VRFQPTRIPEVVLVEPRVFPDDRGFFLETYHQKKFAEGGIPQTFVQDNHSYSIRGTLRGLHAQLRNPQGKLVRVVQGEIFDVAVDIRPGSPTCGQWVGELLSGDNFRQLWVPPGFAHGFAVLSETAHVQYKCTDFYDGGDEIGIVWNDPGIGDGGIDWPVAEPLLSPKDRNAPKLETILQRLRGHERKDPV